MKISFAHNVQNRHKTLRETIEMEKKFFPDSKIYVAYNDDNFNIKYFDDLNNIKFIKYIGNGHKIGCVNGCITSIRESLNDDSDVIVFSHDDVKINPEYINVFHERVQELLNENVDIICRKPHSFGDNYYMMEGFFIKKNVAKTKFEVQTLLNDDSELPVDIRNSPSPEVWLYDMLNETDGKINCMEYKHSTNNYNKILAGNLGFFHKNAGLRGWHD